MVTYKIPVIELLMDDDIGHGQRQSSVRTGSDRQVNIRKGCRRGLSRIHNDELHPSFSPFQDGSGIARIGMERVGAPDKKTLRVLHIRSTRQAKGEFLSHGRSLGARAG